MSQIANAGRDLVQVGRDYVRVININIANGKWGMVLLLLILPFLLFLGTISGTTYAVSAVQKIATNSPGEMLVGRWKAEGYECPIGTKHSEEVRVSLVNDNSFVAVKLVGDDCVPAGAPTFWGKISSSVSKGASFPITFIAGQPQSPASVTVPGKLTIVDENKFTTGVSNSNETAEFTKSSK